jgi:hypothetical protein
MTSRRNFLRTAAGGIIAIPFLPSLVRTARAADPDTPKRMVVMTTNHGGVWPEHMYPPDVALQNSAAPYGNGHTMHWGPLVRHVDGSNASLSPVLSAPASRLTAGLVDRMMLVRGCDVPFYIGHHTGGYLGNYARNDGNSEEGQSLAMRPTIDQVMAWSPSFYPNISTIKLRSMHIGRSGNSGIAWGYSNPGAASGPIQNVPTAASSRALFDDIFVPNVTPSEPRRPVVDLVLEQYRRLTSGSFGAANRLSYDDRQRLSGYMGRLDELERRLSVTEATCGDVTPPTGNAHIWDAGHGGWTEDAINEDAVTCDLAATQRFYSLFNDVIVAAFMCDTSRIVTVHGTETFSTSCNFNAWHQNVAHVANDDAAKQEKLWRSKQWFFENVWLDLVEKLAAVPTDSGTLLDASLIWWTQESGVTTHESDAMPIVAAGSANGFFRTGHYFDYRRRDSMTLVPNWVELYADLLRRPGLLWNQWLATVLQSMGVPPSEFERDGLKGYGLLHNRRPEAYGPHVESHASDILPFIAT